MLAAALASFVATGCEDEPEPNPPAPPANLPPELFSEYETQDGLPIVHRVDVPGGGAVVALYDESLDDAIARWGQCLGRVTGCYRTNQGRLGGCVDYIEVCPDATGGKDCCPQRCIDEFKEAYERFDDERLAVQASFLRGHCVEGFAEQCRAGPQERVSRVGSTYESTPDEAETSSLSAVISGFTHYEITCGREGGVHWDRVIHPVGSPSGTVEIRLTPTTLTGYPYESSANDFELAVFQGPACTDPLVVIAGDQEPDGVPWLETAWVVDTAVPDEICIRVRPLRPVVRSGHALHVSRQ